MSILTPLRTKVRKSMHTLAKGIDKVSQGRITPNAITLTSTTAHIFIGLFIAMNWWWQAAILLIIFGLFDTLDGELARLQKRASLKGMLLDASTDRFKEVFLYAGIGYSLALSSQPEYATLAVIVCGMSLCVSYVKAKGESAISLSHGKIEEHSTLNRIFGGGLAPFEVRMAIVIIGLFTGYMIIALIILAILTSLAAVFRLIFITRELEKAA